MRQEEMSSAGTGSVGADNDDNLEHEDVTSEALYYVVADLVDGDDGHRDGGDDQHGHHPGLVPRGEAPASGHHVARVGGIGEVTSSVNSVNHTGFVT